MFLLTSDNYLHTCASVTRVMVHTVQCGYTFTVHVLRRLKAPLSGMNGNSEVHNQGSSSSVLQLTLDLRVNVNNSVGFVEQQSRQ